MAWWRQALYFDLSTLLPSHTFSTFPQAGLLTQETAFVCINAETVNKLCVPVQICRQGLAGIWLWNIQRMEVQTRSWLLRPPPGSACLDPPAPICLPAVPWALLWSLSLASRESVFSLASTCRIQALSHLTMWGGSLYASHQWTRVIQSASSGA